MARGWMAATWCRLVPKEGRPLRPGSIITREARYRRARRDYARQVTPGVQATWCRAVQARGQALGQGGQALGHGNARQGPGATSDSSRATDGSRAGRSRACPSLPSTPRSSRRPGVALEVSPGVLACLDSQASVRCDVRRPGSCLASWCPGVLARRPGPWSVLAWRDARPAPL